MYDGGSIIMAILGWLLVPVVVIGGIVFLVIHLTRKKDQPGMGGLAWKRFGVATAIAFILPFFIGFSASAVFDELVATDSLIMMTLLAFIFIVVGIVISHHTVISASLIIGSVIALVYALGINLESIPPQAMAIIAGLGLALLIYIAFRKLHDQAEIQEANNVSPKEVK